MEGIDLHQKTLLKKKEVIFVTEPQTDTLLLKQYFKTFNLLDVVVKTPSGKAGNVIIFSDVYGVLSERREKKN